MSFQISYAGLQVAIRNGVHQALTLIVQLFATVVLTVILISALLSFSPWGRDATDEPGWFGKRSGMSLMSDAHSGCQYLVVRGSGITPRIDAQGRHMGCWETSQ